MRRHLFMIPLLAGVLISCDTKLYEDCPADRIVGDWGVVNKTRTFGEYDSLYYVINPIANVNDSIYYNGNYTDSYYNSDPMRVTLRFTTGDSIYFCLDRQYATETNPQHLVMTVREKILETADKDSKREEKKEEGKPKSREKHEAPKNDVRECLLHLIRNVDEGNLYSCAPDSLFKEMLKSGNELLVTATNSNSSSEPQGSQNYEFRIFTSGFSRALAFADSLNILRDAKVSGPAHSKPAPKESHLKNH